MNVDKSLSPPSLSYRGRGCEEGHSIYLRAWRTACAQHVVAATKVMTIVTAMLLVLVSAAAAAVSSVHILIPAPRATTTIAQLLQDASTPIIQIRQLRPTVICQRMRVGQTAQRADVICQEGTRRWKESPPGMEYFEKSGRV